MRKLQKRRDCDCLVGIWGDDERAHRSEIIAQAKEHNRYSSLPPLELLDQRRGYFQRFDFCPQCGRSIPWQDIRSELHAVPEGEEGC